MIISVLFLWASLWLLFSILCLTVSVSRLFIHTHIHSFYPKVLWVRKYSYRIIHFSFPIPTCVSYGVFITSFLLLILLDIMQNILRSCVFFLLNTWSLSLNINEYFPNDLMRYNCTSVSKFFYNFFTILLAIFNSVRVFILFIYGYSTVSSYPRPISYQKNIIIAFFLYCTVLHWSFMSPLQIMLRFWICFFGIFYLFLGFDDKYFSFNCKHFSVYLQSFQHMSFTVLFCTIYIHCKQETILICNSIQAFAFSISLTSSQFFSRISLSFNYFQSSYFLLCVPSLTLCYYYHYYYNYSCLFSFPLFRTLSYPFGYLLYIYFGLHC